MTKEGKTIGVVTGGSSGLGKEFVKLLLQEEGIEEIWAIARDEKKLKLLRSGLSKKIRVFSCDLSKQDEVLKFKGIVKKEKPDIRYLINNAGYGKFCSYKDMKVSQAMNMIQLNCSGVVAMGLICIPYMRQGACMIHIASQSAFQPLPYLNLYSATKVFVRNYSRALHMELKNKGITVTAVCPGWMKTAFYCRANINARKTIHYFPGMVTPDKVAMQAMKDAKKGRDMSVYSIYVKLCHTVAKILPQRAMMNIWLLQQHMKK
jgi:short-subunit dehydrogenase